MLSICDGIIIGGAGGAIAALTVWLVQYVQAKILRKIDCNRAYKWLKENTSNESGSQFRSTRTIASWINLTQDRVRYVCSLDKRIFLNAEEDDLWGIFEHVSKSAYEDRGFRSL
jgi:hypothetical protein